MKNLISAVLGMCLLVCSIAAYAGCPSGCTESCQMNANNQPSGNCKCTGCDQ